MQPVVGVADYIQVTLLGTGSPRPDPERSGPAVLVEAGGKYLLFDSGRGVLQRLEQIDIPITEIQHVFLTHLHSDHISALDDLWLTGWIYQRPEPLKVFGPKGTISFTENLQKAYDYDASLRNQYAGLDKNAAVLISTNINPGVIFLENGVKVTAFLVDHKPVEPAFGYRVDFGDRSVVISGDTTYSDSLIEHSKDVDLLVHEIFAAKKKILERNPRLQKIERYHTNPDQLSKILKQTAPRVAVLTHLILVGVSEDNLIDKVKESYNGDVYIGLDLMRIEIGENIKVTTSIPK